MYSQYKFLEIITALNITFQLVSDVTAGKIIQMFGTGISVSVLFFPITFVISDILTEVYGYKVARRTLLITLMCSIVAGLLYQIAIRVPSASFFTQGSSYTNVLGTVPRILLGGWIAVYVGDLSNNYVLAKLKVLTEGKHLWIRTIASTFVGQGLNTAIFYVIALQGVLPNELLIAGIIAGWSIKTAIEAIMTPYTYMVTKYLKRVEGVDVYDRTL